MLNINASHRLHACGGTLVVIPFLGGAGYTYCDRCHAFCHVGARRDMPNGTDPVRNREAARLGALCSPDSEVGQ